MPRPQKLWPVGRPSRNPNIQRDYGSTPQKEGTQSKMLDVSNVFFSDTFLGNKSEKKNKKVLMPSLATAPSWPPNSSRCNPQALNSPPAEVKKFVKKTKHLKNCNGR